MSQKEYPDELKEYISMAAYFLAEKRHPYDTLCWFLAERQLYVERNFSKPTHEQTRARASEIFVSGVEYDILTWLIAELDLIIKTKKKPSFDNLF
jgi:hypothetical protein